MLGSLGARVAWLGAMVGRYALELFGQGTGRHRFKGDSPASKLRPNAGSISIAPSLLLHSLSTYVDCLAAEK